MRWWDGVSWDAFADPGNLAPLEAAHGFGRWRLVAGIVALCLVVVGAGITTGMLTKGSSGSADDATVTPTGYGKVNIGDTRTEVLANVSSLKDSDIAETGESTVRLRDAEVVFVDGEVVEIHSLTDNFTTPEGVRSGDDVSAAHDAYADRGDAAPTVTDTSITYVADTDASTGYRFFYRPDSSSSIDHPSGEVTEIAIVNYVPTFLSTPVMVVLDASGSMTESIVSADQTVVSTSRWEAAVGGVEAMVDTMPAGHPVGLTVYGASESTDSCDDVQVPVEIGDLDRDSYKSTLAEFTPTGGTPIAYALKIAAENVPTGEKTAIVLVSDGLDSCNTPPCDVAEQLHTANPDLTINTIGFNVDGGAQAELDCIANAGGGVSVLADNKLLLTSRLSTMFNSKAAGSSLRPDEYLDVSLGQTAQQLRDLHPDVFGSVAETGRVEVVYVDCVVVLQDGVVTEIQAANAKLRTVDDLRVGDDVSRAQDLYAGSYEPKVADGSVTYVADPIQRTGYRFDYAPTDGSDPSTPSGRILRIVLCRCVEDILPVDDSVFRVAVFATLVDGFVNMREPHQLDKQSTKASERAYEGAQLDITCYQQGFTYRSTYWKRTSNKFARINGSAMFVATLFLVDAQGNPIEDDPRLPEC